MGDDQSLGGMVRAWRLARDPADVPGYAALPNRRGRRGKHLTQADMALLTDVSERWYRLLESGNGHGRFGLRLLGSVSRILGLDADQRAWLYSAAGQSPPQYPSSGELDVALVDLLHDQPWAAYISDSAWDVRAFNDHAAQQWQFLAQPGANVAEWCLAPDTSYQLSNWEEEWARPMVAQVRMALLEDEGNERLHEVASVVREYEPVDRLWREDHLVLRGSYGRTGQIRLPRVSEDPVRMQLAVLTPLRDTRLRLVVVMLPDIGPLPTSGGDEDG